MVKILVNRIKCNKCGEIIESTHRHDFKFCKCGAVAVDGGNDYLRRSGNLEDWEELSEYENISDFSKLAENEMIDASILSYREDYSLMK